MEGEREGGRGRELIICVMYNFFSDSDLKEVLTEVLADSKTRKDFKKNLELQVASSSHNM